ncbi:hypothetical protein C0J52_04936 [Blattella germanica]|nr:hypothetical protein C0J52_04936 [Blattella germanica]
MLTLFCHHRVATSLRGIGSDDSLPQPREGRSQGGSVGGGAGAAPGRGHAEDLPGRAPEEVPARAAGHAQQATHRQLHIIPYDGIRTIPKRPSEGQARAKFNFIAQTHLELSLVKGELVVLTRRVDDNWFEGRIGNRKGIFPVSYVEILSEPGEKPGTPTGPPTSKPITLPASHTVLMNGSGIKQSMGQHSYQPSSYYGPNKLTSSNPYATLPRQTLKQPLAPVNQTLHIDTHSEPVPYRALYNYRPQNEDELELCEGDTVYVMEKCDDGWYVGSSQRTGYFGTFPGNYVERI